MERFRSALCFAAWGFFALALGCDNSNSGAGSSAPTVNNGAVGNASTVSDSSDDVASQPVPTSLQFQEVTSQSGIDSIYENGQAADNFAILESLGGGVGLFDFDNDGLVDALFPGGGMLTKTQEISGIPPKLFRASEPFKFQDVTTNAHVGVAPFYSHGCAAADYDNDGFVDFVVTGYGGVVCMHNQGDGTFRESREMAGLLDDLWSSSAAWGDLNGDGALDLYLAHYANWSFSNHPFCRGPEPGTREVCPPKRYDPLPDRVYFSRGDGTFEDASEFAGLRDDGKGLGVVIVDFNRDRKPDIYVANDTVDNFLYLNQGDGKLEEVGQLHGVAVDGNGTPDGSMGVDVFDFDGNGLFDIFVANYEHEAFALYRNDGDAYFTHVSQSTGITALEALYVGFGSATIDLDLDGDEDIVVSNGHVIRHPAASPLRQLPLVLLNDEGYFTRQIFSSGYFSQPHMARGLAYADFDHDGDLDLVTTKTLEPASILRNDTPVSEDSWLEVRLIGVTSPRQPIGAVVSLETDLGVLHRQVRGGGSYLSTSDQILHFGIPRGAKVKQMRVEWPSGVDQVIEAPRVGQLVTAIEPMSE